MGLPGQPKTGGRAKGTPNRRTHRFATFLDEVFESALADPKFKAHLVTSMVNMTLDPKTFALLVAHYAGLPHKQVDHRVQGRVTLEQIVTNTVPPELDQELEELDEAATEQVH